MSLESLALLGYGGAGLNDRVPKILTELQGLTFTVVAGATSGLKRDIAAIRSQDTVVACLQFPDAGGLTDRLSVTTIFDTRATGTLTLDTVVANATAVVNGHTYTAKVAPAANSYEFALGEDDTEAAANLAARINVQEAGTLIATSALGVVTLRAVADGTAGNAITLVGSATITRSAATLAGGTATGGVNIAADTSTSSVLVVWYNKQ